MKIKCPSCSQCYEIEPSNIGLEAQCESCGQDFVITQDGVFDTEEQPIQPAAEPVGGQVPGVASAMVMPTAQQADVSMNSTPSSHMKTLACEMCGSTNLIKQDGVFVCQSCGTKYTVEEAKKMMIAGTVNVRVTNEKAFDHAKSLYAANRLEDALEEIKKYIKENPTNLEALTIEADITQKKDVIAAVPLQINIIKLVKEQTLVEKIALSLYNDLVSTHDKALERYEIAYNSKQDARDWLTDILKYSAQVIVALDDLYTVLISVNYSGYLLQNIGSSLCLIYKINSVSRYDHSNADYGDPSQFNWNREIKEKRTSIFNKHDAKYPITAPKTIVGEELLGLWNSNCR
jgi:uncharacterized Zn finger protein (UPF0148 family)